MEKILTDEFVQSYKNKIVPWGFNGLGYIVYKRTYSRIKEDGNQEEWFETIERCINGAQKIGAKYTKKEAEQLYDLIFNLKCNFAGRMLWQLGTSTVDRFGANSLLNCWGVAITELKAFEFLFENLMLGGGVGYSIRREDVHELPRVKEDVKIECIDTKDADFIIPDSRQGWVKLLREVLNSFFITGKGFSYSTILIRPAGEAIKGFGGTASGPKILTDGITNICSVIATRQGKKLRSIDVLDICNIIGSIVVSGNVRRCLPKDSLIHTKNGLIKIQDIKIGDNVLTSKGYYPVLSVFQQGKQKTIKIFTQDGEFICTDNHKMAVMDNVNSYKWKMSKDLEVGDRLITSRVPIDGVKTHLPEWKYIKPEHSTTCQNIKIPQLDEEIAWFLGVFQADGYCYAKPRIKNVSPDGNQYVSLVFGLNELDIAKKAKQQLERFGLKNVKLNKRKNENSLIVLCSSKQIATYFYGWLKQPKTCLSIPECILNAKQSIKLSYLRGIFDGDGACNNKPALLVTTVYEKFAKEIQVLCYSCGLETRLKKNDAKWASRKSSWQTLYHLGVITKNSKNILLKGFGFKKFKENTCSRNANSYPMNFFNDAINKCKNSVHFWSNKNVNIDAYEKYYGDQLFCPVSVIKTMETNGELETFDLEIKDVHEFYCNGYLTHNSAEIALGDPDDYHYIRAKNWSLGNVPNWRSMSNNTLYIDDFTHISRDVWENGFITDEKTGFAKGEPYGFFNLPLSQKFGRTKDGPMKDSNIYPTNKDNCVVTNPCVSPETLILTKNGNKIISSLENKEVEIWNGKKWSKVIVRKTGKNQKLIKVVFDNGCFIDCTENHKFYIDLNNWQIGSDIDKKSDLIEVLAKDLKKGQFVRKISKELCATWIKVESIIDINRYDDTYCVNEPLEHKAVFNGILTGQCGEISLNSYEACNLSELYLNNINSEEEMFLCAKLLYKTQKAICALPFLHEETNLIVHKNMRIGLGVTGVCQSLDKLSWLDKCYKELRKFDKEWSKQNDLNPSIKLSTVKPSGSLSLLAGATPGVHPAYSKYYIRRVRIATNDKLIQVCESLGYKMEYVKGFDGAEDKTTKVVEFPCASGENAILAKDMTAIAQLELVKRMQSEWADNAVSVTVYYKIEELNDIKKWLKENYEHNIKSVSFLLHSGHGFIQAPYEEITKEQYEDLIKNIKPINSNVINISGSLIEGLECAGGSCPIR
jgi:intein/homing endonuclease